MRDRSTSRQKAHFFKIQFFSGKFVLFGPDLGAQRGWVKLWKVKKMYACTTVLSDYLLDCYYYTHFEEWTQLCALDWYPINPLFDTVVFDGFNSKDNFISL